MNETDCDTRIVRLHGVHCNASAEPLALYMDILPDVNHWIPALGGIPMPETWLQKHRLDAHSLECCDVLSKMIKVAAEVRSAMKFAGTFSDDQKAIEQPYIAYEHLPQFAAMLFGNVRNTEEWTPLERRIEEFRRLHGFKSELPPAAAFLLCQTLYGDESTLWALLI